MDGTWNNAYLLTKPIAISLPIEYPPYVVSMTLRHFYRYVNFEQLEYLGKVIPWHVNAGLFQNIPF